MSMICPMCDAAVMSGDSFCEACGQALTATGCVSCGAMAVEADGYCGRCGLRQPAVRDHMEVELAAGATVAAGVSDRGLRHSRNEDSMALAVPAEDLVVGVVCDGVSSSPRPEDASQAAADAAAAALVEELGVGADPADATRLAVRRAAAAAAATAEPGGSAADSPACTIVSAIACPERVTVGWVGDSRAYWLPTGGAAALLTRDDATESGMLTAWLGADAGEVAAQVVGFAPEGPGVVIVCSDGLWNYFPEPEELAQVAPDGGRAPLSTARELVGLALAAGGRDNITVLVIPVGRGG
jgi:serine/threonine protein phosphatase PrpC